MTAPPAPVTAIPCVPIYLSEGGDWRAPLQLVVTGQSNAGDPCGGDPVGSQPWAGLGEALTPYAHWRRASRGGAAISLWSATPQPRYDNDKEWVWPALEQLLSAGQPIDAIVWFQGESDATDEKIPGYYAAAADLFARMRAVVHAHESRPQPDVLILICGLEDFVGEREHWEAIRLIQQRLARDVPRTIYMPTVDINSGGGQHFGGPGYDQLAQRVADVVRREKALR